MAFSLFPFQVQPPCGFGPLIIIILLSPVPLEPQHGGAEEARHPFNLAGERATAAAERKGQVCTHSHVFCRHEIVRTVLIYSERQNEKLQNPEFTTDRKKYLMQISHDLINLNLTLYFLPAHWETVWTWTYMYNSLFTHIQWETTLLGDTPICRSVSHLIIRSLFQNSNFAVFRSHPPKQEVMWPQHHRQEVSQRK